MASAHKISEQMIEVAERMADVADAAQGKGVRRRRRAFVRLLLPATGAALYAIVKSEAVSRQAKGVVDGAMTRASELPADLMNSVRQAAEKPSPPAQSRRNSSNRKQTAARRRS